jgi:hypothetical protein
MSEASEVDSDGTDVTLCDLVYALTMELVSLEARVSEIEATVAELVRRGASPPRSASRAFQYGFDLHEDVGAIGAQYVKLCLCASSIGDTTCPIHPTTTTSPLCEVAQEMM